MVWRQLFATRSCRWGTQFAENRMAAVRGRLVGHAHASLQSKRMWYKWYDRRHRKATDVSQRALRGVGDKGLSAHTLCTPEGLRTHDRCLMWPRRPHIHGRRTTSLPHIACPSSLLVLAPRTRSPCKPAPPRKPDRCSVLPPRPETLPKDRPWSEGSCHYPRKRTQHHRRAGIRGPCLLWGGGPLPFRARTH